MYYYVRYEVSELRSAAEHDCDLVVFTTSFGSIYTFLPPSDPRGYRLLSASRILSALDQSVYDQLDDVGILVTDRLSDVERFWADADVDVIAFRGFLFGHLDDGYRRLVSTGDYYLLRHFLRDFADYE